MGKKIIKIFTAVCFAVCLAFPLSGCGSLRTDKISIVCSLYPQYDFVKQIIGEQSDSFEVKYLLDSGVDLHSYIFSAADRAAIELCDLFLFTGGESEEWAREIVDGAQNKSLNTLAMLDVVEAKEEELLPGMQEEDEEGEHEEDGALDEHVWLSLKNAVIMVEEITDNICGLDPENEALYRQNAAAYLLEINGLDAAYESAVNSGIRKTILFADRFPFSYMADDYGLTCFAAFQGCAAETKASAATEKFLIDKVDELNLPVILVLEKSSYLNLAESVKTNSAAKNQKILELNACQSVSRSDISNGVTYLSIMEDNLDVLTEAIS